MIGIVPIITQSRDWETWQRLASSTKEEAATISHPQHKVMEINQKQTSLCIHEHAYLYKTLKSFLPSELIVQWSTRRGHSCSAHVLTRQNFVFYRLVRCSTLICYNYIPLYLWKSVPWSLVRDPTWTRIVRSGDATLIKWPDNPLISYTIVVIWN